MESRRRARARLLGRLTDVLRADDRIAAAFLTGSLGRGSSDALSDIDVWVVVEDPHLDAVVGDRSNLLAAVGDLVLTYEVPQNAPPEGAYSLALYAGCHQVDWYFVKRSLARLPAGYRVLFDRVGLPEVERTPPLEPKPPLSDEERGQRAADRLAFFWVMAPIAAKWAVRGHTGMLDGLERTVEQLKRLLDPARSGTWEDWWERPLRPPSRTPAVEIGRIRRLAEGVERLMPRVAALGVSVPERAPEEVFRYLDMCAALVGPPG